MLSDAGQGHRLHHMEPHDMNKADPPLHISFFEYTSPTMASAAIFYFFFVYGGYGGYGGSVSGRFPAFWTSFRSLSVTVVSPTVEKQIAKRRHVEVE